MTDTGKRRTAEMVGAEIEAAINAQDPELAARLWALLFVGDWNLRPVGDHRYMVTIGETELLEITAGGPFGGLQPVVPTGTPN